MAGFSANIMYATNGDFTNATAVKGSLANGLITNGQLWIGSTIANAGGTHINVGNIVSAGNSIAVSYASPNINLEAGATIATIYTENTGSATPAANNLNIFGLGETTTIGSGSTVSILSPRVAKFVVDPVVNVGTNQTIQSAINAASSGETIFIRPGTYTENLSLKPGVSLTAFTCDGSSTGSSIPNVLIVGKMTLNASGICNISALAFQTNSDYIIETSNANAKPVFTNCFFNCTNASGMHCITGLIECIGCKGNLSTNGITWFIVESGGQGVLYRYCTFDNSSSTTASTIAGGTSAFQYSVFTQPITTSNAGSLTCYYSQLTPSNNTCVTLSGTGILRAERCVLDSGTASAISVGAGCTANVYACNISSSNTNALTGLGTLNYGNLTFTNTSNTINTTTVTTKSNQLGSYRAQLQPAFLAVQASNATNATGNGAVYTLGSTVDLTEVFDQANNFDPTTGTFTAPITGKYQISAAVNVSNTTIANNFLLSLVTTNGTYYWNMIRAAGNQDQSCALSVLADFNAGDTWTTTIKVTGEAGNTDTVVGFLRGTFMSGYLVC